MKISKIAWPPSFIVGLVLIAAGCGSVTAFHKPTTNGRGNWQIAGGTVGFEEGASVSFDASYGVTDHLDVGGRLEPASFLGWVQYQVLQHKDHLLDLSLIGGGGISATVNYQIRGGIIGGRRFERLEPYIGFLHNTLNFDTDEFVDNENDSFIENFIERVFERLDEKNFSFYSIPAGLRWHLSDGVKLTFEIQLINSYDAEKSAAAMGGLQLGFIF